MKLYKISTYHDDIEGVVHWAGTLGEARKLVRALKARHRSQQEEGDIITDLNNPKLIEKVTVPTDKQGLLQFLRVNAKAEGDTNIGSALVYDNHEKD